MVDKMNKEESKIITLKIYGSLIEAEFAKEQLGKLGYRTFISTDDYGGMAPQLQLANGVRLMILEEYAEDASKILEDKNRDA